MTMRQLSSLDAGFLMIESPTTAGHVGSLILLEPSAASDDALELDGVRALVASRLHLLPILRQRLVQVPLGLSRPYWVDDPRFDLDFHLREVALPSPGSDEQLGEQIARLHARPLDRERPPWEMYVISGLVGGRSAVYAKIHHAAIDGLAGAEMLTVLLDVGAQPRQVEPEESAFLPTAVPSGVSMLRRGLRSRLKDRLRAVRTTPPALVHAGSMAARSPRAPRTLLNQAITPHRRVAFASVPLEDVKSVRRRYGGTVNDVVMAICTSGLRTWLAKHDALPTARLVAAVPVSLRAHAEGSPGGNELSIMLAELPTEIADPIAQLLATREAMDRAKATFSTLPPHLLHDLSTLLPTDGHGRAARALFNTVGLSRPPFNLFISNVPGPQIPLYLAGFPVKGIYPISSISNLTGALNITVFSHDGQVHFGLIACRDTVPGVWELLHYIEAALAELVASSAGE